MRRHQEEARSLKPRPQRQSPSAIEVNVYAGGTWEWSYINGATGVAAGTGGLLFFAPMLMIVFRQKYPRWWFD
jgi:hypothetical protein